MKNFLAVFAIVGLFSVAAQASMNHGKIIGHNFAIVPVTTSTGYMAGTLTIKYPCGSNFCTGQFEFQDTIMSLPELDNLSGMAIGAENSGDIIDFASTSVDLIQVIAFSNGTTFRF